MCLFTGAGVALITPFKENGDIDYAKLAELIEFHFWRCREGFSTGSDQPYDTNDILGIRELLW